MTPIEIPFATTPVRWIMGSLCLMAVILALRWAIPNLAKFVRGVGSRSLGQNLAGGFIWFVILGFLTIPSLILMALVRNPITVVSGAGVSQERLWSQEPDSIAWNQIARVSCTYSRARPFTGEVTGIVVLAADGRKIQMTNSGTAGLGPVHELFQQRLPEGVVQHCSVPFKQ